MPVKTWPEAKTDVPTAQEADEEDRGSEQEGRRTMPRDGWADAKVRDGQKRQNSRKHRPPKMRTDRRDAWRDGPLGVGIPFTLAFGRHKGKRLEDVPVDYLEWILRQTWISEVTRNRTTAFLASLSRPPLEGEK